MQSSAVKSSRNYGVFTASEWKRYIVLKNLQSCYIHANSHAWVAHAYIKMYMGKIFWWNIVIGYTGGKLCGQLNWVLKLSVSACMHSPTHRNIYCIKAYCHDYYYHKFLSASLLSTSPMGHIYMQHTRDINEGTSLSCNVCRYEQQGSHIQRTRLRLRLFFISSPGVID